MMKKLINSFFNINNVKNNKLKNKSNQITTMSNLKSKLMLIWNKIVMIMSHKKSEKVKNLKSYYYYKVKQ